MSLISESLYSRGPLVAQRVTDLPAVQEARVRSLVQKDPEQGNGSLLQGSGLDSSMERSLAGHSPWGLEESETTERPSKQASSSMWQRSGPASFCSAASLSLPCVPTAN